MSHFAKIEDGIVTKVIVAEQEFIDTPLSPIVLNGSIVTSGGTIVSCWTGDDKNVKFMENRFESHYKVLC